MFSCWAGICADYCYLILFIQFIVILGLMYPIRHLAFITNPVDLWSSPSSQSRIESEYFNQHFGPFYRIEQIIIKRSDGAKNFYYKNKVFSPIFKLDFLEKVYYLQNNITHLKSNVNLEEICFSPLSNGKCVIQSQIGWFQSNVTRLHQSFNNSTYLDHIQACMDSSLLTQDNNFGNYSCLGDYGGPAFPDVALGGFNFENKSYTEANSIIITILVNNHVDDDKNNQSKIWEKAFVEYMKSFNDSIMDVSFLSEVSESI